MENISEKISANYHTTELILSNEIYNRVDDKITDRVRREVRFDIYDQIVSALVNIHIWNVEPYNFE